MHLPCHSESEEDPPGDSGNNDFHMIFNFIELRNRLFIEPLLGKECIDNPVFVESKNFDGSVLLPLPFNQGLQSFRQKEPQKLPRSIEIFLQFYSGKHWLTCLYCKS